ncbi:MAG: FliH/SctL family protein [bacterium]
MLIKSKKIEKTRIDSPRVPTVRASNRSASIQERASKANANMKPEDYQRQIAELQRELDTIRESSYKEGFQEGEKAGAEQAASSMQFQTEQLKNVIEAIQQRQNEIISHSEDFVLKFAFKVAEKILGSHALADVRIDKKKLQTIIHGSLEQFPDSSKYTLKVHKETATVLGQYTQEIMSKFENPVEIAIREEPTLKIGDCLVETDFGILDARIESQFNMIRKDVLNAN